MTNQSSDTQPALRPLNVSVRAGRLTKFKGRVASIAPGLLVVATAAALVIGGADQADAQAAPACGQIINGVVRVCPDASIPSPGITPHNGIEYNAGPDGLTLMLDAPDNADNYAPITVEAWGVSGAAVRGADNTSGDIAVLLHHGSVTTDGPALNYNNHGLEAYTEGSGDATAQMNGGDVTTHAVLSYGLRAEIKNAGSNATAKVEMTEGRINSHSGSSSGLSAGTDSIGGAAIAEISGGTITTHGGASHGIAASVNKNTGSAASATARMTGGLIRTHQNVSHGVLAESNGGVVEGDVRAEVLAEMSGGTIITRGERDSHGVRARLYDNTANSKATATARMTRGVISTTGYRSAGISAAADASCDCDAIAEMNAINGSSTITTEGEQAHGIRAVSNNSESASEASAKAVMRNGSININGRWAHGISVQANGGLGSALAEMRGGTITTTHGGASAIYVRIHNEDHTNNSDNTNGAKALMTGGTIHTENRVNAFEGSHGLHADTTGSADVVVEMKGGSITTLGRNSHGLWAEAEADAMVNGVRFVPGSTSQAKTIVKLDAGAVVTASGAGSNGIRVSGNYVTVDHNSNSPKFWLGVKEFDVDVAGIVTGGAGGFNADDDGAAIRTISDAEGGGTIDIADTAIVAAGGSGIAIQDGDGDAVVTLEGTVTGDVRLGAGDDRATIGATASFDFSSYILDGGSGDNDHLTLHGRRTMTSMENVRNWEHLTLKDEMEMRLDGMDRLDMGLSIDATSTFRASGGELTITGDVTNAGDLTLSVQDGAAGDVITIDGDYTNTGSGRSVFELDAVMGADGANTDRLEITGNASGEMVLSLAGLDNASAGGGPLEIYVVSVGGTSEDATFTLVGGNYVTSDGEHAVISGAHLYRLAEVEAQDGGKWWALSARLAGGEISWGPSAPIYDSYGASLLAFNAPSGLHARGSSQDFRTLAWSGQGAQTSGSPLWVQMGMEQITSAAEQSTTGAARDSSLWEMEIGADIVLDTSTAGLLVGGLMLSYGTGSTDVSSDFGDGSIETTGLGLGLAATWYDRRGFYVDGQVTVSAYSSDLSSDGRGSLIEGNSGTGYALSIEAGQQLDLGSRLTVIPQAQLSLSSVTFSDFTSEAQGEQRVSLEDAVSQQLRLGLEFGAQDQGASGVYGMVNLYHDFGSGSEVRVGPASLTSENEAWALGFGIGGSYAWNDRVDLFGEASYATGLSNAGDVSALSASAGFKVMF